MPSTAPIALWERPPRELAAALFQESRDAILLIDLNGRVIDANPAAVRLTGRPPALLRGAAAADLLEHDDRDFVSYLRERRGPATFRLRTGAGEQIPVSVTASDLSGSVPLVLVVLRDVRELHEVTSRAERAEEERQRFEARYRNMVEGSLQGVLIHQDERLVYANPALARMFGYDGPAELIGRLLWETFVQPEDLPVLRARTAALFAGESLPPHPGWCAIGKDGRRLWVATAASLIDWDGRPAVVAYYLDITERKRAEEALRASERFVQAITNGSPHTMYVFDRVEGRNIWANRHITDDLGYTAEEVQQMGSDFCARLLHPDDLARLPALLARWNTVADDEVLETEYRMRHADGSWRWFVGHDTVFSRDPDGRVRQFLGTTQDVTARKRVEEELRESRALYASLVESLPIYLFRKDLDGRFQFANQRFCELAGVPLDQLLGRTDAELWAPDLAAEFRADDLRVIATGQILEKEEQNRLPDGTPVRVQVIKTPVRDADGAVVGVQGVFWDITERKRAEEQLAEREARLRTILESEPECVKLLDRDGRVLEMNAAGLAMIEADSIHQVLGHCVYSVVVPEHRAAFEELLHRVFLGGEPGTLEFEIVGLKGTRRWLETHSSPLRDNRGQVSALLAVTRDVTARRSAEAELRQSEARLASVIANSPGMAIQWYDAEGRVVMWNRASEEMFGYTADEAMGKALDQLIHTPEEFALFRGTCTAIARSGEPIPPTEYTFRRRSGEPGTCLSTLFRIPGPNGTDWFVCMDIDITERKRAEEERRKLEAQMRQAQKLESLGVLAGGIAHDFNNLLTSVLGYANLASMDLPAASPTQGLIAEIEKAAQRAAELTQQMLAYSGRGKFVVQPVALDGLVREMNKLLQTVVSKKAVFHLELAPATIEADATQIRQVVMNLITNASDALEGQPGAIVVRAGTRHMTAEQLRSPFVPVAPPAGEYAFLEVEDSGCGMSEETLSRIFDPFFTTKFTGRGLGLAAVLGIIRGHRGSLQITSAPGLGTTFHIYFPSAPAAPERPVAAPTTTAPRGHGCVLVVDDEENVRMFTQRVLEGAGFKVIAAADGIDALKALHANPGAFRAAVLDLTMPHLDGWEVAAQFAAIEPGLPVLLISGYSDPEQSRREAQTNVGGFLQKPFRPAELLEQVSRIAR